MQNSDRGEEGVGSISAALSSPVFVPHHFPNSGWKSSLGRGGDGKCDAIRTTELGQVKTSSAKNIERVIIHTWTYSEFLLSSLPITLRAPHFASQAGECPSPLPHSLPNRRLPRGQVLLVQCHLPLDRIGILQCYNVGCLNRRKGGY